MKILLRLPNWIGDSVMISPAFALLKNTFKEATFTIVGNKNTCDLYDRDKRVSNVFIDKSKDSKIRILYLVSLAKEIKKHDIAISFNNSFFSALLIYLTKTPIRIGYAKNFRSLLLTSKPKFIKGLHQVYLYLNLVNNICKKDLFINIKKQFDYNLINSHQFEIINQKNLIKNTNKKYIGISTGAAYGSAKRWEEEYFLILIKKLLVEKYEVFLFGSANDYIDVKGINNKHLHNLYGKTDIHTLCDYISSMDAFVANDSGSMHIAASFKIPLVAIFGPTNQNETRPMSNNCIILDKKISCAPCKKRKCPLLHHNCMKQIKPDEVIESIRIILKNNYFF